MKPEEFNPQPLILTEGYYSDQYYDSYKMLMKSAKNWKQFCPYQLQSNGMSGRQRVLQLHSMQIVFAERKGGTMHNAVSAKDTINIAVNETCEKSCFGRMKIHAGEMIFFDDSQPYNLITNDTIKFVVITVLKSALGSQLPKFSKAINCAIRDTDARLTATLYRILKAFTDPSRQKKDTQSYQKAENEILAVIMELLAEQIPTQPKLTRGERRVLDIRDKVFDHMDGKINIASLAKEHQISEQTMQKSFKSLFGFKPKHFFRLLKLNHIHYELMESSPDQSSVSKVAFKWGFTHMGRFSAYYAEFFGEKPSETLKDLCCQEKGVSDTSDTCVNRQEEITWGG